MARAKPSKKADALKDFEVNNFSHMGYTYPVYRKGAGPGVVIIHEVPGITPEVARFARMVADAGFTVFMPSLFGTPGKKFSLSYVGRQISMACVRKEFAVMEANKSSPVTDFLRGLCKAVHEELDAPVGAIGMCLTGNFALTLAVDSWVNAPVLSQPSLPFSVTPELTKGLHISPQDLAEVKRRIDADNLKVLGLRFTHDPMCRPARFRHLEQELGAGFESIEIDSSLGNRARIPPSAHSVVTTDLLDEAGHPTKAAKDRVLAFFREQLGVA